MRRLPASLCPLVKLSNLVYPNLPFVAVPAKDGNSERRVVHLLIQREAKDEDLLAARTSVAIADKLRSSLHPADYPTGAVVFPRFRLIQTRLWWTGFARPWPARLRHGPTHGHAP